MKPVIVTIPVYNKQLSALELCSLRQCFNILGKYPFALICPEEMDPKLYIQEAHDFNISLQIERFNGVYFEDIKGYNRLLLSKLFFERFKDFRYLLIHQLDAYIFKDEVSKWCEKKIDFIGAPWFIPYGNNFSKKIDTVGNGGLSLRNIPNSLKILKRVMKLRRICSFWYASRFQSVVRFHLLIKYTKLFWRIKNIDKLKQVLYYDETNEDQYWTLILATFFKDFKIANAPDAIQFSFEKNASWLFEENNRELPFGCHGWGKYEPEFWRQFIDF